MNKWIQNLTLVIECVVPMVALGFNPMTEDAQVSRKELESWSELSGQIRDSIRRVGKQLLQLEEKLMTIQLQTLQASEPTLYESVQNEA